MIIKKKSMIVALVSGYIVASVLVLTLIGYAIYLELKNESFIRSYDYLLQRLNAKNYSGYLEFSKLNAGIESSGPLKGNPVIEGVIKNTGQREVSDLLVKVKFLDHDGAAIYEVVFRPQEPSLGASGIAGSAIPHVAGPSRTLLKQDGLLPFKKILTDCPKEILPELKGGSGFAKDRTGWSGRFEAEPISLTF